MRSTRAPISGFRRDSNSKQIRPKAQVDSTRGQPRFGLKLTLGKDSREWVKRAGHKPKPPEQAEIRSQTPGVHARGSMLAPTAQDEKTFESKPTD